jgi:sugar phosphate isomerase/epimerase
MRNASALLTRRGVLFGIAGTALAGVQPRNRMYNPQLAIHSSLWLAEAAHENKRLDQILDEAFMCMRRAGYQRVELTSDFLRSDLRKRTLTLLHQNKLQPAILFTSGPLHEKDAAEATRREVLETAWVMTRWDTRFVNFSPDTKADGRPKTSEELETQAYHLSRMGQDLAQVGLDLMVHHHLAEMLDNAREWRYMRANTETGLVSFCLDVDWVTRAGLRPVTLMDEAGSRLRSLHLRNPRNGINQELLRDGDINMVEIARFLRQMSYDGYLVVEPLYDKDTKRQYGLTEALSLSRWYMQQVFGSRPGSRPVDMGPHVRERKRDT